MQENNYLGKEKVGKLLLEFAIPSTLALIISCLYNIVDQIFVGNGIGYLGNAATGIVFPITVIGWGASVLFGDGMATFLSLSQGKGDTSAAGRSAANSIFGSFLSGVVIIAVCYALGDRVFYALGATDATIGLTRDYGNIIFMMMPLALVQNTLASIIRADGSPKYSMAAMVVGAVINMIGDPVARPGGHLRAGLGYPGRGHRHHPGAVCQLFDLHRLSAPQPGVPGKGCRLHPQLAISQARPASWRGQLFDSAVHCGHYHRQ